MQSSAKKKILVKSGKQSFLLVNFSLVPSLLRERVRRGRRRGRDCREPERRMRESERN
jgi:hypothetical protein